MEHFITILRALNKRRLELILVPTLTMCLILYLTFNAPSKYKTEAKLYLNLQEGKGTSLTGEDLKQYQVQSYFTNTIELLKSSKTLETVQLKILTRALMNQGFFANGNKNLILHANEVTARLIAIADSGYVLKRHVFPDSLMISYLGLHQISSARAKDMIVCFRIMDSNFMKFELTENVPLKAQELASVFIDALVEENRALSRDAIRGHKDIIEALVRQAKIDLENKVKQLEKYKVQNDIINLAEHTKAIVVYLVQLEGQRATLLSNVAAGEKGKLGVLKTIKNGNELLQDVSDNKDILELKSQLKAFNREMMVKAFEKNTTVPDEKLGNNITATSDQIKSKLEELTRKISYDPSQVQLDLVGKYVSYDLESGTSTDMIQIVEDEIGRVKSYSSRFAPFESIIGSYEQEINTAQNVYLTLLNKLNLTQSLEYGSDENVIDVIDRPYFPTHPEPSKRMLMVGGGGVSVFVVMVAVFVIIQLLDARIITVDQFERSSKLPVLAGLPDESVSKNQQPLVPSLALVTNQQVSKLMQHVISTCIADKGILLVASGEKGEGKHFLTEKLNAMFRDAGFKVTVFDADWMSDEYNKEFVDFRPMVSNSGLIIHQQEIRDRLRQCKDENDLVIVIAAPLSISAEASFWTSLCKHVVYVFKAKRVIKKVDKRMEDTIINARLQSYAAVLNRIDIESMEDYLGEIPRRRNRARIFIKKLLTRNF